MTRLCHLMSTFIVPATVIAATVCAQGPNPRLPPQGVGIGDDLRSPFPQPAPGLPAGPYPFPPAQPPNATVSERHRTTVFEPAEVMARVGDRYILKGDIQGEVNLILAPFLAKLPPDQYEQQRQQIEEERERMTRQLLKSAVETQLLYLQFLRGLPADKLKEVMPKVQQSVNASFEEGLEQTRNQVADADADELAAIARKDPQLTRLALAMTENNLDTLAELDVYLRTHGTSLEKQRRAFGERMMGRQSVGRQVDYNPEVTHDEMLDYYHQHAADFEFPAKARWEQLTARLDRFPSEAEAWKALGEWGNMIIFGGVPFAVVAKRYSQGTHAEDGGYHDWITRGSLKSKAVEDAVFTLPIGQLSPRIKDDRGFHIIQVLERREAGRVDFTEAQSGIKETLRQEKVKKQLEAFLKTIQVKPLWTIYDGEQGAESPESGS